MSDVFSALADPTRRELMARIGESGETTATELARALPISRQAVQKHLAALAEAGLVAGARSGREVRYRLTPAPMTDAVAWITRVGGDWDDRLATLARHVQSRESRR